MEETLIWRLRKLKVYSYGIALSLCFQLSSLADVTLPNDEFLKRSDGSVITFYLERHESESKSKVLLLVLHGSDCNSVTHIKSVRDSFWNVLPNADLLTIEKYGIDSSLTYNSNPERQDCPKSYLLNDNPSLRANDSISVLNHLLAKYQYNQIVLLGGSEGALVANLVTSKVNWVTASIVFNGGGRWFLDDVLHSVTSLATSENEAADSIKGLTEYAQHILSSEPFEMEMSGHGYAWWRSALEIDQQELLEKTSSPVLLIQSGKDENVSPIAVDKMIQNLRVNGKNNISYLEFANLNHGLEDQHGINKTDDIVLDMRVWLESIIH